MQHARVVPEHVSRHVDPSSARANPAGSAARWRRSIADPVLYLLVSSFIRLDNWR